MNGWEHTAGTVKHRHARTPQSAQRSGDSGGAEASLTRRMLWLCFPCGDSGWPRDAREGMHESRGGSSLPRTQPLSLRGHSSSLGSLVHVQPRTSQQRLASLSRQQRATAVRSSSHIHHCVPTHHRMPRRDRHTHTHTHGQHQYAASARHPPSPADTSHVADTRALSAAVPVTFTFLPSSARHVTALERAAATAAAASAHVASAAAAVQPPSVLSLASTAPVPLSAAAAAASLHASILPARCLSACRSVPAH